MIFYEHIAFVDSYLVYEMHLGNWHTYLGVDNFVELSANFFHRDHFALSYNMIQAIGLLKSPRCWSGASITQNPTCLSRLRVADDKGLKRRRTVLCFVHV